MEVWIFRRIEAHNRVWLIADWLQMRYRPLGEWWAVGGFIGSPALWL